MSAIDDISLRQELEHVGADVAGPRDGLGRIPLHAQPGRRQRDQVPVNLVEIDPVLGSERTHHEGKHQGLPNERSGPAADRADISDVEAGVEMPVFDEPGGGFADASQGTEIPRIVHPAQGVDLMLGKIEAYPVLQPVAIEPRVVAEVG